MFQTIFGSSSDVNWKVEININRDLEVIFQSKYSRNNDNGNFF